MLNKNLKTIYLKISRYIPAFFIFITLPLFKRDILMGEPHFYYIGGQFFGVFLAAPAFIAIIIFCLFWFISGASREYYAKQTDASPHPIHLKKQHRNSYIIKIIPFFISIALLIIFFHYQTIITYYIIFLSGLYIAITIIRIILPSSNPWNYSWPQHKAYIRPRIITSFLIFCLALPATYVIYTPFHFSARTTSFTFQHSISLVITSIICATITTFTLHLIYPITKEDLKEKRAHLWLKLSALWVLTPFIILIIFHASNDYAKLPIAATNLTPLKLAIIAIAAIIAIISHLSFELIWNYLKEQGIPSLISNKPTTEEIVDIFS